METKNSEQQKQNIFIPSEWEYQNFIELAHKKTKEDYSVLHKKLKNATYIQWAKYLHLI